MLSPRITSMELRLSNPEPWTNRRLRMMCSWRSVLGFRFRNNLTIRPGCIAPSEAAPLESAEAAHLGAPHECCHGNPLDEEPAPPRLEPQRRCCTAGSDAPGPLRKAPDDEVGPGAEPRHDWTDDRPIRRSAAAPPEGTDWFAVGLHRDLIRERSP